LRKLTQEEFINRVKKINQSLDVLSEYAGNTGKVTINCSMHGVTWDTTPQILYRSCGCHKCSDEKMAKTKRKNYGAVFKQRVHEVNPDIEIVGEYIDSHNKVKARCLIHNCTWDVLPHSLLLGRGCIECGKDKISSFRTYSHEQFLKIVRESNPNIEVVGTYVSSTKKIEAKCMLHDYTWRTAASNLLKGCGCPECRTTSTRLSHDEFLYRMDKVNPNIEIIDNYAGRKTKIKVKCKLHNVVWITSPEVLLQGCKCPSCVMSKGETAIRDVLNRYGVPHFQEYKFPDCKKVNSLEFDFYIPSINTAIEFQGEQHYWPIDFGGKGEDWARQQFEDGQERDAIKREYCAKKHINLVEIRYDQFYEIEQIISDLITQPAKVP
jgi:hypothetical protein